MGKVYTAEEANKAGVSAAARAGLRAQDYSGRGMFGQSCVAVSGDRSDCVEWVAKLPPALRKAVRWDSMGRGEVAYLGSYGMDPDALMAACPDLD